MAIMVILRRWNALNYVRKLGFKTAENQVSYMKRFKDILPEHVAKRLISFFINDLKEIKMSVRKCIKNEQFLFLIMDQDGFVVATLKHLHDALSFIGK
jgi:hypothetical protein